MSRLDFSRTRKRGGRKDEEDEKNEALEMAQKREEGVKLSGIAKCN